MKDYLNLKTETQEDGFKTIHICKSSLSPPPPPTPRDNTYAVQNKKKVLRHVSLLNSIKQIYI